MDDDLNSEDEDRLGDVLDVPGRGAVVAMIFVPVYRIRTCVESIVERTERRFGRSYGGRIGVFVGKSIVRGLARVDYTGKFLDRTRVD